MGRFFGWIVAAGVVLGSAATADAQIAVSVGNPYAGIWGAPVVGYSGISPWYASTYSSAPLAGITTYSSGYAGYAAPAVGALSTGSYGAYPMTSLYPYGYSSYAVGTYGWPSVVSPYYGYGGWGWRRGGLLGGRGWRW